MHDALRSLRSSPGLSLAAVLTLALAIGLNAAMFGLIDRALLSPPPGVADAARVVNLAFERGEGDERARMASTSYVTYRALREGVAGMSAVAAWQRRSSSLMIDGEQVRADAVLVSGSYFGLLGASARVGRAVQEPDDRAASDPVVVLSDAFWRNAFGSDPGVLGRRVTIDGLDYAVAGIMAPGFTGHSVASVDLWIPFAAAMRREPGWEHQPYRLVASIVARLAPGTPAATAAAQASGVTGTRVLLTPLAGANVGSTDRRVALWLAGVSALVFVIGLANAATLLLVRAARRRRDTAIRAALGASRGRLLAEAFVEASLLSAAAVVGSLLLALWFDWALRRVLLPDVAPAARLTATTILAALGTGIAAAIATGLASAAHLPRTLQAGVLESGERVSGARGRGQTALLVLQIALSVVLLAGAGMFGRSLHNLLAQDFGIRMDGVFVIDFAEGSETGASGEDVFGDALDRVRALPGVRAATVITSLPFAGHNVPPIAVPGRAEPPSVGGQLPFLQAATKEFFDILGVTIREGRALTAADERGAPVVVVNETMARTIWPGESAIGKCIRIGFDPSFDPETAAGPPVPSAAVPCRQIVGVAHDMRQRSLLPEGSEDRLMQYFVPYSQVPVPPFIPNPDRAAWGLLVEADANTGAIAPAIRRVVAGSRTDLPFVRVRPYAQLLDRQLRPWKLGATLFTWFSALALIVAAVGLYAAFAQMVAQRRREMAIRVAIGAAPRRVMRLVVRDGCVVAGIGIGFGSAGAIAGGRSLQWLLFQTSGADPAILAAAAAVMLAVGAAATWLPARAASRADPATLLRA